MATYATIPAYIQVCKGWEPRLKEHPIMAWMFEHEEDFDRGSLKTTPFAQNPYHTSDFTLYLPNGTAVSGGEPAWSALMQMHAPFTSHFYEPTFVIIFATPDEGYELVGVANIFANLLVPGEQTKPDLNGDKWDICVPGSFHFKFVKDVEGPGGFKMSEERLYADGVSMVGEMVKRGMVTAEQAIAGPPQA
jgi:hypothetical protein